VQGNWGYGDVWRNGEKAFWECRASGGDMSWTMVVALFIVHLLLCSPRYPQFPPLAPHSQNVFQISPVSPTGSAFQNAFFPFTPSFHQLPMILMESPRVELIYMLRQLM